MYVLDLNIFYIGLPGIDGKLAVLEEHHLGEGLLCVLLEDGEEDAVDVELVAGLLAEGADPAGVGRLGGHHEVVGQVEALVVGAEDASGWDFYFFGGECASEGYLHDLAGDSV